MCFQNHQGRREETNHRFSESPEMIHSIASHLFWPNYKLWLCLVLLQRGGNGTKVEEMGEATSEERKLPAQLKQCICSDDKSTGMLASPWTVGG